MQPIEYIKRKNEIIKRYTGITLVPEDQIIDLPREVVGQLSMESDGQACPYCHVFYHTFTCLGCPMSDAENECGYSIGNTYTQVRNKLRTMGYYEHMVGEDTPWYKELSDLIDQYNKLGDI